jgi:hypothetical protein
MANDKRTKSIDWWKADKKDAHKFIFDLVSAMHNQQQDRMDRNIRCLQLYGNNDLTGMSPYSYMKPTTTLPENRVKVNIISSMVDTVCAKISKMKPKTTFLTSGGDFEEQEKAKKLDKFILGAFYQNNIYRLHQEMFRDGTVMDLGALKHTIDEDAGTICTERVLATEIYVDLADGVYGWPTHMYQVKVMHKDNAMESWPSAKMALKQSSGVIGHRASYSMEMDDFVVVIEAWRLPYGSRKGRHVICCENGTMVDEPYNRKYFPFTFSRWAAPLVGFYGQSLADRLTGNQVEINKMLRVIQKSFHLGSAFKVFLEYGSKVAKEHINNDIGSIIYYTGQAPQFYVPKTVHEEFFRHLEWLIQTSYEEAGVSQLSAQSKKPAGLESGRALRDYNEIESERFAITSQTYEQTFLDTAKIYIDLAREMHEEGIDMKVTAQSKRFIESIKWSEIDLESDGYIMQMFPTSMLPHQPAGRLAFVQELMQGGLIPADFGLRLLDFPDLDEYLSLKNASIDDLMDTLYQLLYEGKWVSPEPFQDLKTGIPLMQSAYLKAKKDGAPESRLDLIRRWMAAADAMDKKAQQAAMIQQSQQQASDQATQQITQGGPEQAPQQPTLPAEPQVA